MWFLPWLWIHFLESSVLWWLLLLRRAMQGAALWLHLLQWQTWHLHGHLSGWNGSFCSFTAQDEIKLYWLRLELDCGDPNSPEEVPVLQAGYLPFPALALLATWRSWGNRLCEELLPWVCQNFSSYPVCIPGFASPEGRGNHVCLDFYVNNSFVLEGKRLRNYFILHIFEWLPPGNLRLLENVTKD